jgi:hypothetical protein
MRALLSLFYASSRSVVLKDEAVCVLFKNCGRRARQLSGSKQIGTSRANIPLLGAPASSGVRIQIRTASS